MHRPTVFVTWPMTAERQARAILERVATVEVSHTEVELPLPELIRRVAGVDAIIPMGAHRIPAAAIDAAPHLGVIAVGAAGYNIVDVAAATRRHILVSNAPGVLTETTADMAWALMLAVARRLPEAERLIRAGQWSGVHWSLLLGADIHGATLGVIGLGRIGKAVARRARGFDMRVLYHSRQPDPEAAQLGAAYASKADLLKEADFVVLTVPLSPETHHLIGAPELAQMKPTAFLINVARGPVVDEAALVAALAEGQLAGAGLDVFEDEPRIHPGLLERDNVALTPHVGSASRATRLKMATTAAENCVAALQDRRPPNLVNPDAWRPA